MSRSGSKTYIRNDIILNKSAKCPNHGKGFHYLQAKSGFRENNFSTSPVLVIDATIALHHGQPQLSPFLLGLTHPKLKQRSAEAPNFAALVVLIWAMSIAGATVRTRSVKALKQPTAMENLDHGDGRKQVVVML
jgi:uncharacterized membrane protein YgcG